MKKFVLYKSSEEPHRIAESEFEKYTENKKPFKQFFGGSNHYYATCPECENTIQLKGLYTSDKKYGAHAGKYIEGLNPFNFNNYIYCPRAVKGKHVPKDARKEEISPKDIEIYNIIRDNFDIAIEYAKKHLGYYISDAKAKDMLYVYYNSQGWLYPHSTVNNIPFMLCYLQSAINPYGLCVRKNSELENAILKTVDLQTEPISDGNIGKYYNKLLPKRGYCILSMMIYNHQFKEDDTGTLKEFISIHISKNISQNPERYEGQSLVDLKIQIPELDFVNFINLEHRYRNKNLLDYSHQLMPELQLE